MDNKIIKEEIYRNAILNVNLVQYWDNYDNVETECPFCGASIHNGNKITIKDIPHTLNCVYNLAKQ